MFHVNRCWVLGSTTPAISESGFKNVSQLGDGSGERQVHPIQHTSLTANQKRWSTYGLNPSTSGNIRHPSRIPTAYGRELRFEKCRFPTTNASGASRIHLQCFQWQTGSRHLTYEMELGARCAKYPKNLERIPGHLNLSSPPRSWVGHESRLTTIAMTRAFDQDQWVNIGRNVAIIPS